MDKPENNGNYYYDEIQRMKQKMLEDHLEKNLHAEISALIPPNTTSFYDKLDGSDNMIFLDEKTIPKKTLESNRYNMGGDTIKLKSSRRVVVSSDPYMSNGSASIFMNVSNSNPTVTSSKAPSRIIVNKKDTVLTLKMKDGNELLRFEDSGDIYLKNEFVTNDFQIVEGFREYLRQYKLHP